MVTTFRLLSGEVAVAVSLPRQYPGKGGSSGIVLHLSVHGSGLLDSVSRQAGLAQNLLPVLAQVRTLLTYWGKAV